MIDLPADFIQVEVAGMRTQARVAVSAPKKRLHLSLPASVNTNPTAFLSHVDSQPQKFVTGIWARDKGAQNYTPFVKYLQCQLLEYVPPSPIRGVMLMVISYEDWGLTGDFGPEMTLCQQLDTFLRNPK